MGRFMFFITVLWLFWAVQPEAAEAQDIEDRIDQGRFEASVHGMFSCISCHDEEAGGKTGGKTGEELGAAVSKRCTQCHTGAGFDYPRSIHMEHEQGPNCVTCHGSHYISPAFDASSPVNPGNIAQTCGSCHPQEQLSFEESFHGKAVALGSDNAPDCAYCHRSHDVLEIDNPVAMVSAERKNQLCTQCHAGDGLGTRFAEHYPLAAQGAGAPMYWVKKVFMWLILIVVGFFLIHIELELWHKLRLRKS